MGRSRVARQTGLAGWWLAVAAVVLTTGCGIDAFAVVSPQGGEIVSLFVLEIVLATLVCLAVAGATFYAMVRYRHRPGAPEPPQIHGNTKLELAWTAAPALLLVFLYVLTVRTMATVEAQPENELRIRVIAHQWWWEFEYPGFGIVTANELQVPVGQPVRLELESADVVHNFWIPQFGWKKDNTPNHVTMIHIIVQQPGVYDGSCNEFCGVQHAWMRVRAIATSPDEFQSWVTRNQQPAQTTVPRGQQVFQQSTCINCHAIQGVGGARVGPDLSHFGSRTIIGAGVLENTPDNLHAWLRNPQRIKPGVLMPGYQDMPEEDMRALVDYLEGLK